MKYLFGLCVALCGLGVSGCKLLEQNPLTITTTGTAIVTLPADTFQAYISLYDDFETREQALEALSKFNSDITTHIGALEGLETITLNGGDPRIEAKCIEFEELASTHPAQRQLRRCARPGFSGSMAFVIKGQPINVSGNLISLASEYGATEAFIEIYSISDQQEARSQARKAAVLAARQQAQDYAEAIGGELGPVLAISPEGTPPQRLNTLDQSSNEGTVLVAEPTTYLRPRYGFEALERTRTLRETVNIKFEIIQPE